MKFCIWKKISLIEFNECGNFLKDNFGVNDILLLKININNENYLNYYENYYIVNQSNDCYNESYIHNGYYLKEGDFINVNIIVKFEVKMFCLKMIKNVLLVMIIIIWKMRIVF